MKRAIYAVPNMLVHAFQIMVKPLRSCSVPTDLSTSTARTPPHIQDGLLINLGVSITVGAVLCRKSQH